MLPLAILSLVSSAVLPGPEIRGVVRGVGESEPVANVLVVLVDERRQAWSDSLGEYHLAEVSAGGHRMRFSRLGYESLEIEVVVPETGDLRLDVHLTPRPIAMRGVGIESGRGPSDASGRGAWRGLEIGVRSAGPFHAGGDDLFGADPLQALAEYPDVLARPELATTLHVRGGSGDQNVVFLDGLPIYSPTHSGGALSAVNPDIIEEVRAHAGVSPASQGGVLSSVIEIETRSPAGAPAELRGAVEPGELRQTAQVPFPARLGGLLVSGRRANRDGFSGAGSSPTSGFGDLYAKLALRLGSSAVDVLSFTSGNRLLFDAVADPEDMGLPEASVPNLPDGDHVLNHLEWSGGTQGVVWRGSPDEPLRWEARAWRSDLDASVRWSPDGGPLRLEGERDELGASGRVAGAFASGQAEATLALQRIGTSYRVRSDLESPPAGAERLLDLRSAPTVLSASLDESWLLGSRWGLAAGARAQVVPGVGLYPEPRLAVRFSAGEGVLVSAGYSRTHQFAQSLRNEESVLDAVFGIDLPAAVGDGVPVARADQLAGAIGLPLGGGILLSADGYVRWMDGLVLVAPVSVQPFATDGFARGSGRAWGADIVLARTVGRLRAQAAYGLGFVTRRDADQTYRPSFDRGQSLAFGVGYRVRETTWLHAALRAFSGAPTTPVGNGFGWSPPDPLHSGGEISGSPVGGVGPVNGSRLPAYLALDVGVRHDWRRKLGPKELLLTGFLSLSNVLDRSNVFGLAAPPIPGDPRPLSLLPRGLTFGLAWRY